MRCRVIFFIIICTFTMHLAGAQSGNSDTKEWAPIGAKWWYSYSGHGSDLYYLALESVGDTIVLEKNARILEIQAYYTEGSHLETIPYITYFKNTGFNKPQIIIHQQGDSIYYLRNNNFELLYDFSLK